jgi:formylglycine-generating enzyme
MRWFFLLIVSASAVWAQPLVTIETVSVGDTNNEPHSSGIGSVAYPYRIGKYEVTIGQYAAFLNSVAAIDPSGLYNTGMASDQNIAGITRQGSEGTFTYAVNGPFGGSDGSAPTASNRPIAYVSWFDAARFCNWLHNGATNGADTEDGAYMLNGATNGKIARNPTARWWLPTLDEWVKAGHYKGGGTNAGFWLFPTASDFVPLNKTYGGTNRANFYGTNAFSSGNGVYTLTGSYIYRTNQNYLTDVGSLASPSSYETFDQGGNLWEWTGSAVPVSDGGNAEGTILYYLGGYWRSPGYSLRIGNGGGGSNTQQSAAIGFRVAAALPPTPTLTVEQPPGSVLMNNTITNSFGGALTNSTTTALTYTIRNTGAAALNTIAVILTGANTNQFVLTPPTTQQLAPDASTTFAVAFRPQTFGNKTAQVSITSNDTDNNPFIVNLQGYGLDASGDFDGDGLNDAAEFTMSALGFDWQSNQPTLVTALYSNANRANLFTQSQYDDNRTNGQTDVMTNPAAFNLFDSTQYEAHRISGVAQGKAEVTSNPTAYSLFTESSIMDMNLGSLMLKKRADANALDLELTIETKDNFTTDGWQVAERITRLVSMVGVQRQFLRVRADDPYVAPNVKMLAHPTLGNILTDGAGRVLYFFTSDTPGGNPMFNGSSWPYVSVPAAPKADASVTATIASSSFGRSNGPFLTINTRPAYTYAGDTTAGQATGHGAGWVWYTIKADGTINQ